MFNCSEAPLGFAIQPAHGMKYVYVTLFSNTNMQRNENKWPVRHENFKVFVLAGLCKDQHPADMLRISFMPVSSEITKQNCFWHRFASRESAALRTTINLSAGCSRKKDDCAIGTIAIKVIFFCESVHPKSKPFEAKPSVCSETQRELIGAETN